MATTEIDKELDQLKSDISNLRSDMSELIEAMKDNGIEHGRDVYHRTRERARRTGEAVRERAGDMYDDFGRTVEERPMTSVLTAFGTGFVVGMLLDRQQH